MKTWTPDASQYFETWLGQVRSSVAGDPRVDPNDVAEDLRAHVHAELDDVDEVTVGALTRVIDSLGPPAQWGDAPATRLPRRVKRDWFQRNVSDLLSDAQRRLGGDLGVPVLLLVLTAIGLYGFMDGGVVFLAVAYFVARGHVMYVPGALSGRKRWLIYLPLAIGASLFVGLVLGVPLTFEGSTGHPMRTAWMLGAWWVVVGLIAGREPRRVRAILRPFAETFETSHGRMLSLLGAAFLIASTVLMFNGRF